jgi:hypothetical protein
MLATHASASLLQTAIVPFVRSSCYGLKPLLCNPKVKDVALRCIQGGSSFYLSSFGVFELTRSVRSQKITTEKTQEIRQQTFSSSSSYLALHGACMLGSGISYLFDLFNKLGVIIQQSPSTLFATLGNVAFLCANLVSLDENIRLYQELIETQHEIDPKLLRSTCWGITSNTGYILAMGALLFGYANALTLLIALLSCLAGGIKILYDVMILLGKEKPRAV